MGSLRPDTCRCVIFAVCFLAAGCASPALDPSWPEPKPGAQGAPQGPAHEQRWLIPDPAAGVTMAATLWRPDGAGPFPLAVIAHASSQDAAARNDDPAPKYRQLALWFVRHGYAVVLPVRPGQAPTGGPYREDQFGCVNPVYIESGLATAEALDAALSYMWAQSFVRKEGAVIVGQSAGGWGALALASENPPGVRAIVNFSGGRGGHAGNRPGVNCASEKLVAAAAHFGASARVPSLWLYAGNDSYFSPALSRQMADAWRAAGGKAEYDLLPPQRDEGHFFVEYPESAAAWSTQVESFLARTP
ncbi:peptidase [Methylovirgula ligni]|uniref:Dienelactone hydrolase n=3 Tax=Methylovirgula ligni TaxID=569860 RepID=A0A3D9YND3_9HYPH|nr:peptidase [Methylovirgula ligni]REF84090.1 dienelactone hydrolase [Methylovirgula ligni]